MIHFVTALACEARPLRRELRLGALGGRHPFPVFRGIGRQRRRRLPCGGGDVALVVTGVGRAAAAAGTAYLGALTGASRTDPWINVGVGGHRELPVGAAVVAHSVREASSGRTWYPPRAATEELRSAAVLTVDDVETAYPGDEVYEMEAAGFWPTANRFASAELVQVLKVISDGPRAAAAVELDAAGVEGLVEAALPGVLALADALRTLAGEGPPPAPDLEPWRARWRLTVTEGRRLEALLRRWGALGGDREALLATVGGAADAGELLGHVERAVEELGGAGAARDPAYGGGRA